MDKLKPLSAKERETIGEYVPTFVQSLALGEIDPGYIANQIESKTVVWQHEPLLAAPILIASTPLPPDVYQTLEEDLDKALWHVINPFTPKKHIGHGGVRDNAIKAFLTAVAMRDNLETLKQRGMVESNASMALLLPNSIHFQVIERTNDLDFNVPLDRLNMELHLWTPPKSAQIPSAERSIGKPYDKRTVTTYGFKMMLRAPGALKSRPYNISFTDK